MYDAYVSVDLGRQVDFTALVVAEEAVWVGEPPTDPWGEGLQQTVHWPADGRRGWVPPSDLPPSSRRYFRDRTYLLTERPDRPPLLIRHVERVRGRPYPQIVADVRALLSRPPLAELSTVIVADAGGVGGAVSDLMWQQGVPHVALTATGGDAVHVADGGRTIRCPKRELVAAAQICLAEGRLRIAAGLAHAPTLTQELQNYRVTISAAGHDSYAAREDEHDDLVYAAAQLCWYRDWNSQHYDDALAAAAAEQRAARHGLG